MDMNRSQLEYKYRNFMSWLRRHPITILMITYDPKFDNKYHKYESSFDEVKFHSQSGIWRKVIVFTSKARML